jgi:hypothetical protein
MNIKQLLSKTVITVFAAMILAVPAFGKADAAIVYDPNGNITQDTPVFNEFVGVPFGVGDESDFVRVKPQAGTNADFTSTLNAACNTGDAFTVRTYIHNGATPTQNLNGTGPAVAHNVQVALRAPLDTDGTSFPFRSTVTANNAATVADNGVLDCGTKKVTLSLVPNSVKTYSLLLGFQGAPDSAVNSSIKVGSRVQGSGDQWGCWDDRILVVYDVMVQEVKEQPLPSLGDCKLVDIQTTNGTRNVTATVTGETTNATIIGYKIDWGDGTPASDKQTDTHTYAKDGTFTITTSVLVRFADGTTALKSAPACTKQVTFKVNQPPQVLPPPPVTPVPPVLPNTGPGTILATFLGMSSLGTLLFNRFGRRFGL